MSKHSKDHHYLPQGILRNFCFSGRTVFFADRENSCKGIQERNTGSIFFQKHVNSFQTISGERDDSPEKEIAKEIDDRISVFIRDLLSKPVPIVSESDKKVVARYIISLALRLPKARSSFLSVVNVDEQMRQATELTGVTWEALQEDWFDESVPQSLAEYLSAKLVAVDLVEYVELLIESNFAFAVPSGGGSFIIGDFPLFGSSNQLLSAAMDEIEIWTVVAPTLMVGFLRNPHIERNLQLRFELDETVVEIVNLEIAERSKKIASKDRANLQKAIARSGFFSEK